MMGFLGGRVKKNDGAVMSSLDSLPIHPFGMGSQKPHLVGNYLLLSHSSLSLGSHIFSWIFVFSLLNLSEEIWAHSSTS